MDIFDKVELAESGVVIGKGDTCIATFRLIHFLHHH